MEKEERRKIFRSIFFPLLFVAVLWAVKIGERSLGINLVPFGLLPREWKGLAGIFTSPLIHSSSPDWFSHLFSNTVPLLVLGSITFYFYRPIAFPVFFWVYFMSGIWLWAGGRGEAYHIGASGLVYGFASFLFFSGIFRKEKTLMVLSLLVVFLYGSLVWGMLPILPQISWESHLLGALAGVITAFYFRKEGPQAQKFEWEDEEEESDTAQEEIDKDTPPL